MAAEFGVPDPTARSLAQRLKAFLGQRKQRLQSQGMSENVILCR